MMGLSGCPGSVTSIGIRVRSTATRASFSLSCIPWGETAGGAATLRCSTLLRLDANVLLSLNPATNERMLVLFTAPPGMADSPTSNCGKQAEHRISAALHRHIEDASSQSPLTNPI